MKVTELATELGKAIQEDGRFIRYNQLKAAHDDDVQLQETIRSFTEVRNSLIEEKQAEKPDEAKCTALNETMRKFYEEIMENESMKQFNDAKADMDGMMSEINGILTYYITGEEPCTHDCSTCGGCH